MKICKNCNKAYSVAGGICPVCGNELLDTDDARVQAANMMGKFDQADSKFGKFMKAAAKMTMKAADVIDRKYK